MRDCKTCVDYGNCTADDMASCAHGDNIGHSDYRPKMSEYIEKEAVHNLVRSLTKYAWTSPVKNEQRVTIDADDVQFGVDKIPSADVAPIQHGKWIMPLLMADGHIHAECSHCHKIRIIDDYCSACGTVIDLEDTED